MFGLWVVPFETCIIIAFFYNETFTPKILQTEEMLILIKSHRLVDGRGTPQGVYCEKT